MRIDLPLCGFKACRYQYDGNCTKQVEYTKCSYINAVKTLESIMGSQKLCVLCQNELCKNSTTSDALCEPVWNGIGGYIGKWQKEMV